MNGLFGDMVYTFAMNLDAAPSTKSVYTHTLKRFGDWIAFAGKNINELSYPDLLQYKAFLINSKLSENTIDLYLTVVRKFYKQLALGGDYTDIAAGLKLIKHRSGWKKKSLELEEVKTLLGSISQDNLTGKRDYALINLLVIPTRYQIAVLIQLKSVIDFRVSLSSLLITSTSLLSTSP
ncbi:Tyrosine recombinase XerD, partial [termite gut metagenome]